MVVSFLLFVIVLIFLWPRMVITIRSGEGGVLYSRFFGGTVVDNVYPEGIYLIWPWDELVSYNLRLQALVRDFTVLTSVGLPVTLKMSIRFKPEQTMLGYLHQRVGPDYINSVVIPEVEAALRRAIGGYSPEAIYTTKKGMLQEFIGEALEPASQKFVIIDDVIIRSVTLPDPVQRAIEEKLVHEQEMQAYVYRLDREVQEAERKRREAEGIYDYQKKVAESLKEPGLLQWLGIQATEKIAQSSNSKVVVIGSGKEGMPIILGGQ
ncbi:MAG: prohibitin family protein [Magnetococcales bacterium]|nr:prohibitin family protein [Magnetococcales bacterium]